MAIPRETPGSENQSPRVVYWKNGAKSNITDGSRTTANAKMVVNGNDVLPVSMNTIQVTME
ncbi:hypothetical protein [Pedobacter foliorum]|uniref:hypothetical protein n=1 Tax=Pedobacter foliorum TaxID=2739058 RepID=UPI001563B23F|nr:hypothetical protein [Pedobacter foliorum]NRF37672.1 hypothetical protein [Pedobacter foliorum]